MVDVLREKLEARIVRIPEAGCHLWIAGLSRDGYGSMHVDGRNRRAHRVAYELYVGRIPTDMQVCHRCDVPTCVNPAHLFLGTQADNMKDKAKKKRCADRRGEKHPNTKMKTEHVLAIREALAAGVEGVWLAEFFGVSQYAISKIKLRKNWAHI